MGDRFDHLVVGPADTVLDVAQFNKKPPARVLSEPLPPSVEVIVVGSEHYTDLRKVKAGPAVGVTVEPEPGNRYDRNAVKVCWNGQVVGYLSAVRAKTYGPLLSGVHPVEAHVRAAGGDPTLFVMLPKGW